MKYSKATAGVALFCAMLAQGDARTVMNEAAQSVLVMSRTVLIFHLPAQHRWLPARHRHP